MSPYFKTCPRCGAHLDPGEVCDCQNPKPASACGFDKKTPASSTKADEGKQTQRDN